MTDEHFRSVKRHRGKRKSGFLGRLFSCFRTKGDTYGKSTHKVGVVPNSDTNSGKPTVTMQSDPSKGLDFEADLLTSGNDDSGGVLMDEEIDATDGLLGNESSQKPASTERSRSSSRTTPRSSRIQKPSARDYSLPLPSYELSSRYRPQVYPRLPPQRPEHRGKKLLILDMDETLVHSTFSPEPTAIPGPLKPDATFFVPLEGMSTFTHIYKRPYLDAFLDAVCEEYEVAVFTASVSFYADKILDIIDPGNRIPHRLYRQHCTYWKGAYLKDISLCNRDLSHVIIVDNSPTSFLFNWRNAVPILTWVDDPTDTELSELANFLTMLAPPSVRDIRPIISRFCGNLVAETVSQIWQELSRIPDQNNNSSHSGTASLAWQANH